MRSPLGPSYPDLIRDKILVEHDRADGCDGVLHETKRFRSGRVYCSSRCSRCGAGWEFSLSLRQAEENGLWH